MVDEIVTRQELIDAKRDAQDLGKAVNEKVIVNPRYGGDFKSLPMIADEFQDAINTIVIDGGVPAFAVVDASGKTQQQINDAAATKFGRLRDTYDLMTDSQIQDVKDGVPSFDASSIIQNLITESDETTVTIKHGTYFIGTSGIQLAAVKDKKIIFEKGAILKWHPLATFSSNIRMFNLTNRENITFDKPVLRGANDPSIWVKTEKVICAVS